MRLFWYFVRLFVTLCIILNAVMTVVRTPQEIIITLPTTMQEDRLQSILDYITYCEASVKSQATQVEADDLATEAMQGWWAKNQHKFLKP